MRVGCHRWHDQPTKENPREPFAEIGTERANLIFFFWAECARALLLSSLQFRFGSSEIAQAFFPIRFPSRAQPVDFRVRLHDTDARHVPLRSGHALLLDATEPTLHPDRLQVADGPLRGFHRGWGQSFQKYFRYGLIDLHSADREAVHPASLDDIFTRAMIARGSVSALIVGV